MKTSLSLVAAGAALLIPMIAQAQPGLPPGVNPAIVNSIANRAQQSDVLYWYNLLPPKVFNAFGDVDRLELLQNKGSIYDRNSGFIEVLMPGDANENDVEKLQVKLYQGQRGLMVAVSRIVWNQPRVKGALAFFALTNDGQLVDLSDVTRQVFPFELKAPPAIDAATATDKDKTKKEAPPINAYLSQNDTTISTGVPETEIAGDDYSWDGTVFRKIEAPAEPRDN